MPGALNRFLTKPFDVTTTATSVYTPPIGYTAVILLAQFVNNTSQEVRVSAGILRSGTYTAIMTNGRLVANDAISALTGRLILQYGDSFRISASDSTSVQLVLSFLETRVIGS